MTPLRMIFIFILLKVLFLRKRSRKTADTARRRVSKSRFADVLNLRASNWLKSEVTLGTYGFLDFESNPTTFSFALELKNIRFQRIIKIF